MTVHRTAAAVALALPLLLASCASLPMPRSSSDTVLVIPTLTAANVPSAERQSLRVVIRTIAIGESERRLVAFSLAGGPYSVVTGLAPGEYVTEGWYCDRPDHGGTREGGNLAYSFLLEPGRMTILTRVFYRERDSDPLGSAGPRLRMGWRSLSEAHARAVMERVSAEKAYPRWAIERSSREFPAISDALRELGL